MVTMATKLSKVIFPIQGTFQEADFGAISPLYPSYLAKYIKNCFFYCIYLPKEPVCNEKNDKKCTKTSLNWSKWAFDYAGPHPLWSHHTISGLKTTQKLTCPIDTPLRHN